MSVAHRLTERSVLPPPVQTWTDLDCGCSRADNGSWIVARLCNYHHELIPEPDRARLHRARTLYRRWQGYGPFRPVNG